MNGFRFSILTSCLVVGIALLAVFAPSQSLGQGVTTDLSQFISQGPGGSQREVVIIELGQYTLQAFSNFNIPQEYKDQFFALFVEKDANSNPILHVVGVSGEMIAEIPLASTNPVVSAAGSSSEYVFIFDLPALHNQTNALRDKAKVSLDKATTDAHLTSPAVTSVSVYPGLSILYDRKFINTGGQTTHGISTTISLKSAVNMDKQMVLANTIDVQRLVNTARAMTANRPTAMAPPSHTSPSPAAQTPSHQQAPNQPQVTQNQTQPPKPTFTGADFDMSFARPVTEKVEVLSAHIGKNANGEPIGALVYVDIGGIEHLLWVNKFAENDIPTTDKLTAIELPVVDQISAFFSPTMMKSSGLRNIFKDVVQTQYLGKDLRLKFTYASFEGGALSKNQIQMSLGGVGPLNFTDFTAEKLTAPYPTDMDGLDYFKKLLNPDQNLFVDGNRAGVSYLPAQDAERAAPLVGVVASSSPAIQTPKTVNNALSVLTSEQQREFYVLDPGKYLPSKLSFAGVDIAFIVIRTTPGSTPGTKILSAAVIDHKGQITAWSPPAADVPISNAKNAKIYKQMTVRLLDGQLLALKFQHLVNSNKTNREINILAPGSGQGNTSPTSGIKLLKPIQSDIYVEFELPGQGNLIATGRCDFVIAPGGPLGAIGFENSLQKLISPNLPKATPIAAKQYALGKNPLFAVAAPSLISSFGASQNNPSPSGFSSGTESHFNPNEKLFCELSL